MIELDWRAVLTAVTAFVATLAGPFVIGGWVLAGGVVAAILTARSVFRGDEADVTAAVATGGAVILGSLLVGHAAAFAVAASVFGGAELAAMGRWMQLDHDAPVGREITNTLATIGVGSAAGAAAVGAAQLHAAPLLANIALAVTAVLAGLALVVLQLRRRGVAARSP